MLKGKTYYSCVQVSRRFELKLTSLGRCEGSRPMPLGSSRWDPVRDSCIQADRYPHSVSKPSSLSRRVSAMAATLHALLMPTPGSRRPLASTLARGSLPPC